MRRRALHRRLWILAAGAFVSGCSTGSKKSQKGSDGPGTVRRNRRKGPKTMGNLLLDSYMADLKTGTEASKVTAARELANMGSKAKAALPLLEPLKNHANPNLSEAARQAIKSIKQ